MPTQAQHLANLPGPVAELVAETCATVSEMSPLDWRSKHCPEFWVDHHFTLVPAAAPSVSDYGYFTQALTTAMGWMQAECWSSAAKKCGVPFGFRLTVRGASANQIKLRMTCRVLTGVLEVAALWSHPYQDISASCPLTTAQIWEIRKGLLELHDDACGVAIVNTAGIRLSKLPPPKGKPGLGTIVAGYPGSHTYRFRFMEVVEIAYVGDPKQHLTAIVFRKMVKIPEEVEAWPAHTHLTVTKEVVEDLCADSGVDLSGVVQAKLEKGFHDSYSTEADQSFSMKLDADNLLDAFKKAHDDFAKLTSIPLHLLSPGAPISNDLDYALSKAKTKVIECQLALLKGALKELGFDKVTVQTLPLVVNEFGGKKYSGGYPDIIVIASGPHVVWDCAGHDLPSSLNGFAATLTEITHDFDPVDGSENAHPVRLILSVDPTALCNLAPPKIKIPWGLGYEMGSKSFFEKFGVGPKQFIDKAICKTFPPPDSIVGVDFATVEAKVAAAHAEITDAIKSALVPLISEDLGKNQADMVGKILNDVQAQFGSEAKITGTKIEGDKLVVTVYIPKAADVLAMHLDIVTPVKSTDATTDDALMAAVKKWAKDGFDTPAFSSILMPNVKNPNHGKSIVDVVAETGMTPQNMFGKKPKPKVKQKATALAPLKLDGKDRKRVI